jgi:hypothetical protein
MIRTCGILFLATAALTSCGPPEDAPAASDGPMLVIGVDGLEWDVVRPLAAKGAMPNLAELMQRGMIGKLETFEPAKSPVIWTTIATGKLPVEHGILDFTRVTADGRRVLYESSDRRSKAIWNILTDANQESTVVGWWNTFPVETINGMMVAQANTLEHIARRRLLKPGGMLRGVPGQVYPAHRQDEILSIAARVDDELPTLLRDVFGPLGRADDQQQDRDNLDAFAWSLRADESNRRVALRLAREEPLPDWFGVYFGTTDVVGHRFWRYHEPEVFRHPPSPRDVARFGDVVEDSYRHVDQVIGELVDEFPEDATVFVISDHGMHAHNTDRHFDVAVDGRIERESGGHDDGPEGLLVVAGPEILQDTTPIESLADSDIPVVGSMVDVLPTILALRGVAVGRDMPGEVMSAILDPEAVADLDVEYVETHEDHDSYGAGGADDESGFEDHDDAPPWTEERIEQLESLGYIDDPDDPSEAPEDHL